MIRHGSSHGMAVLVCTLSPAVIMISLIRYYMPKLLFKLRQIITFSYALFKSLPHRNPLSRPALLFVSLLSGVWFSNLATGHNLEQFLTNRGRHVGFHNGCWEMASGQ